MEEDKDPQDTIKSLNAGSQIILQRHGESESNAEYFAMVEKYGSQEDIPEDIYHKNRFDSPYRDTRLSDVGKQQCQEAQGIANQLNIHTVFVSPLRRAVETAYLVYKDHPNFENIKFIILPSMREILGINGSCPIHIDEVLEEFKPLIPQLDDSEIDKRKSRAHWFVDDLKFETKNDEYHKKIDSELCESTDDTLKSNFRAILTEIYSEVFPNELESKWGIKDRAESAREFVKEYLVTNDIPEDQKVVLVGHYVLFSYYTAKWDKEPDRSKPIPTPDY